MYGYKRRYSGLNILPLKLCFQLNSAMFPHSVTNGLRLSQTAFKLNKEVHTHSTILQFPCCYCINLTSYSCINIMLSLHCTWILTKLLPLCIVYNLLFALFKTKKSLCHSCLYHFVPYYGAMLFGVLCK